MKKMPHQVKIKMRMQVEQLILTQKYANEIQKKNSFQTNARIVSP